MKLLEEQGLIAINKRSAWQIEDEDDVKFLFTKHENCLKRDVVAFGEGAA